MQIVNGNGYRKVVLPTGDVTTNQKISNSGMYVVRPLDGLG